MEYTASEIEEILLEPKVEYPTRSRKRAKVKEIRQKKQSRPYPNPKVKGQFPTSPAQVEPYLLPIYARNEAQEQFLWDLLHTEISFCSGIAGTGKTLLAVSHCVELLCKEAVEKIILCRPAVEADEHIGFLPGGVREKLDPYLYPLYDALEQKLVHVPGGGKRLIESWITQGMVEIAPLGYQRGRTFRNAAVLLDESQNATYSQLKMFLTRIGENSHMVLTGDLGQSDIGWKSGYEEVLQRVYGSFPVVGFSEADCVRSENCKVLTRLLV